MAVTAAGVTAAAAVGGVIMGAQNAKRNANAARDAANAAANSRSTTEEIKHLTPVEQQAMGAQGYIGARNWRDVTNSMKQQNIYNLSQGTYGSNYLLPGQAALQSATSMQTAGYTREAEYAAYDMLRKSKASLLSQIDLIGIDDGSGKNPYGVKITYDEYEQLMRAKDPSKHISNGSSLGDKATPEELAEVVKHIDNVARRGDSNSPEWVDRYELLEKLGDDIGLGGEALLAMTQNPKYAKAIKYWQSEGVIDDRLNINQGQLLEHLEDFQSTLIETRTLQPMTYEQEVAYKDGYSAAVGRVVDPKLVKITDLGDGVKRTTIMNADGKTPAASFLTGSFTLENGQTVDNVTLTGSSRRDWSKYQETVAKTGPLFSDAINGGGAEAESATKPPGYKGASLNGGEEKGKSIDPRTIAGYEQGLSYMGGFPGGVAPLSAENAARAAQGISQIGPSSMQIEPPVEPHVPVGSGLPGGLADLPSPEEIKKNAPKSAEASFGGGSSLGMRGAPANNVFAEGLEKV